MSHPSDAVGPIVDPVVSAYLAELAGPDDPLLNTLEAYCAVRGFPLVGRASGRALELLARMIGAKRVFELGSGFGYSALFFARAVGDDGCVFGTDLDAENLEEHERLFAGHPLKRRISLRQGDAIALLDASEGLFDVIFVDIHKEGYVAALEAAVPRLRPGGLLLVDNTLWGGKTARPASDPQTAALQEFNRRLYADPRLLATIWPVGDGLAVAWKKTG